MSGSRSFPRAATWALMALAIFAGCGGESGDEAGGGEIPSFGAPPGKNTNVVSGTSTECAKISGLGKSDGGMQSVSCACTTSTSGLTWCQSSRLTSPCREATGTCAQGSVCRCSW